MQTPDPTPLFPDRRDPQQPAILRTRLMNPCPFCHEREGVQERRAKATDITIIGANGCRREIVTEAQFSLCPQCATEWDAMESAPPEAPPPPALPGLLRSPKMLEVEWDDRLRRDALPMINGWPDFSQLDDTDATRDENGATLRDRKQREYYALLEQKPGQ